MIMILLDLGAYSLVTFTSYKKNSVSENKSVDL